MKTLWHDDGFEIVNDKGIEMVRADVNNTNTITFTEAFLKLPTWGDKIPYAKQCAIIVAAYNEEPDSCKKLLDVFALTWKDKVPANFTGFFKTRR